MKKVTSLSNPEIKRIRSLAQKKYREEEKVFVTEGLRHALEAAEAGWEFDALVLEEGAAESDLVQKLLKLADTRVLEVSAKVMESLTRRDNAQAVLAVLKQRWASLEDVTEGIWVVLEEIRDPGNLGTIMRTCDGVGAEGVILVGKTCDPWSQECVRASMGTFARAKMLRAELADVKALAGKGFQVVGTHLREAKDYREVKYTAPLALVLGNEQAGMSDDMADACTIRVKMPMRGGADSLNVAVAAGVMLYEVAREFPLPPGEG